MKPLLILALSLVAGLASAQDYLKLGDECYNNKDYACAYDNYIKGHTAGLKANKDVLFYRIGACLRNMGKYEEGKKWQHLSLAEKSTGSPVWELAIDHYNTKTYDSAALYYTRAYGMVDKKESRLSIAYWNANSYHNLARYKNARAWIDTCLKIDPQYAEAHSLSGLNAVKEYNSSLAETSFKEVLKLTKDSSLLEEALNELGHLKYNQKLYLDAIPYYRAAKKYAPDQTNPWAYIADSYRLTNAVDSSEYYYKLVIEAQMARPRVDSVYIARVAGVAIAKRLQMKDTVKAMPLIPTLLRYNAYHSDAKTYLNLLYSQKDIKTLETVLPLFLSVRYPRGGILYNPLEEASYYTSLGNLYRDAKQYPQAIRTYNTAWALNPAKTDPLVSILRIMIADKKYKEAADSIQLKLPQVPVASRAPVLLVKAELATLKKDTAAAALIYRDIIKNSPTSANYSPHFYLGSMALQRKDSAQCWEHWSKISSLAFYETNELALPVLVYAGMRNYNRASTVYAFEDAARYLDKAAAIDSTLSRVRLYAAMANINCAKLPAAKKHLDNLVVPYAKKKDTLAMIYRALGYIEVKNFMGPKYETAIGYYKEAQKANPQDSTIALDLGTVYYEQKEYAKAAEAFGAYATQVKARNNKATGYYNQALCYYMNKQHAHAKAQVAKCLELVPDHADGKKLKAELEKPAG